MTRRHWPRLTITYTHPIDDAGSGLRSDAALWGNSYADMIARCYFDYVRVYAPAGSEVGLSVDGSLDRRSSTSAAQGAAARKILPVYFVLPPGGEHEVTFTYRLPPAHHQRCVPS